MPIHENQNREFLQAYLRGRIQSSHENYQRAVHAINEETNLAFLEQAQDLALTSAIRHVGIIIAGGAVLNLCYINLATGLIFATAAAQWITSNNNSAQFFRSNSFIDLACLYTRLSARLDQILEENRLQAQAVNVPALNIN
jgi:hypothetical protein